MDDPIAAATLAQARRDEFLFRELPDGASTVFDRFTDVPGPGELRMMRRISQCFEVLLNTRVRPPSV